MPSHMQGSLIFHYNLKFYDSDGDSFEGVSLKRFVMQVFFFKRNQFGIKLNTIITVGCWKYGRFSSPRAL